MKKSLVIVSYLFLLTGCLPDSEKDKKISELETKIALLEVRPTVQRYQIVIGSQFPGKFTYLVDTQKGKIWSQRQITDVQGQPTVWLEDDLIDNSGEIGVTWDKFMTYNKAIKPKD